MSTIDFAAVLNALIDGRDLELDGAQEVMAWVLAGEATPAQIAGLLVAFRMKPPTVDELTGFVRALQDASVQLDVPPGTIDTCSTGGSPQRRIAVFHVGTLSGLVAAGAGARVCKHGNRKATGTSGSADLLAALGVDIDPGVEVVKRCVEEAGMGFCLAPAFHPGMRHAGPVRGELGVRTVFNQVAALSNPARVKRQVVGVADGTAAEKSMAVLRANGAERVMVVHGHDGLDELTTTGPSHVVELVDGEVRSFDLDPRELGIPPAKPDELLGGDTDANVAIARRVLGGEPGPHRDIVVLNAAAALVVADIATDLEAGLALASTALDDGSAGAALAALIRVSNQG